jgi:hypothetical protein
MSERKAWTTPKLLILGRGRPEENVLSYCKGVSVVVSQNALYSLCHRDKLGNTYCGTPCQSYSPDGS